MLKLVRQVIWPPGFIGLLSNFVSLLSALTLVWNGFQFGIGPTFQLVLDYYDTEVIALIG